MGNIKIKTLKAPDITIDALDQEFLYKDVAFDLQPTYSYNNVLNRKEYQKDIQAIFDIESVKNSIVTAFTTSPGQKILNPTYGVDLKQYLFEPVDNYIAQIITDDIETKLPRMEPRIKVHDVMVVPDEEQQQYTITFQIDCPSLNVYGVSIRSELKTSGYTIV